MGNHRTAKVVPEIVELQGADGGRKEVARVESVVAEEFIGSPVVLLRAGLHLNDDLPAGAATVLRHVAGGNDIDFTNRVQAGSRHHGTVGARARGGRPLDLDV